MGGTEARLRKANAEDVSAILALINGFAEEQLMLPRSPLSTFETLRDFTVAELGGRIVGCGALHVVWGDLAEVRSLAVDRSAQGTGLGMRLGHKLLDEATTLRIPRVFAFTYVPRYFERLGFEVVEHSTLPHKVFSDCMNCPKFQACDEIAMLKILSEATPETPPQGPLSRPLPGLFQGPYPHREKKDST